MDKRQFLEEMPYGKLKDKNLREEVMLTPKKSNLEGRLQKMMSLVVDLLKRWMKKWISELF